MLNIYVDWSGDELVTERRRLSKNYARMISAVSAGDTNVSYSSSQLAGVKQAIHEINLALFALDPTTYPLKEGSVLTDRTFGVFGTNQRTGLL